MLNLIVIAASFTLFAAMMALIGVTLSANLKKIANALSGRSGNAAAMPRLPTRRSRAAVKVLACRPLALRAAA